MLKFIHTADWHLGKIVHGTHMTDNQRSMLMEFLKIIEEEKPDAVIIAGDLYDRSVPPTEAVELLNEILFKINIEMKVPVIAISGNHDSAERLSFGTSWYKQSNLHISGVFEEKLEPVQIKGVNFYCIPFAEPSVIRVLHQDDSITSHQAAMKSIIGRIESGLKLDEPNVLVGHAFVTGGQTTDSERILSVGGSGSVDAELFAPFSYTALGHLHSPDAIKHDKIYYSGSLLKYSFSEANQSKSVNIVDMEPNGSFSVRKRPLIPKLDLREIKGFFEEIMDPAFYGKQNTEDYIKVVLKDEGNILDPVQKLKQIYPNILHLEREWDLKDRKNKTGYDVSRKEQQTELELFANFYGQMTDRDFDDQKKEIMARIIDDVKKEEV